ncbi:MAG: hydrogenase maturation protease [Desulfotalea sp.]
MISTLIVCIGNDFVADDGIGQVIYSELLKQNLPDHCRIVFLGLGGVDLIEKMDGEQKLIVVDAVQFGAETGTIHKFDWLSLPALDHRPVSGHGIGVREALEICSKLYPERLPKMSWLIGVEGECFDQLGTGLSPAVSKVIPDAVASIMELI